LLTVNLLITEVFYSTFPSKYFLLSRQKESTKEKLPAYNLTAKNLLGQASLDKLLASLVNRGERFEVAASEFGEAKQYLRSPFSYGFLHAANCNAG